jgi:phosphoserine aminotransferase
VRTPSPHEPTFDSAAAYVHYTSNETIQGVQFAQPPACADTALVCDCSSDFLSRPWDVERHALLYAGAQKNAGPAGVTIVIARQDVIDTARDGLPAILDYRVQAREKSLYNTPPVFAVYVVELVTRWLLETMGGLEKMAEINQGKAQLVYDAIDTSGGYYAGHAERSCRSQMNVTFRLPSADLEKTFVEEAAARGMLELKGHRSVGGIRASLYNAVTVEAAERLADFMKDFRERNPA